MQQLTALLVTMRPRQWSKNVLFVFPAIFFGRELLGLDALLRVLICCLLMVMMSGCVYIINDLFDIEGDRQHPTKRERPIAAGQVSVRVAAAAATLLVLVVLTLAFAFDRDLLLLLLLYLLLQLSYTKWLKHVVILDVLVVATGFVLRIAMGAVVIDITLSPWLTTAAGLLALFLVISKRRQEYRQLGDKASAARAVFARYNLPLLDDLLRIVTTAVLLTYTIYALNAPYLTIDGVNVGIYTVPVVFYGLFRYLYLMHVEEEGGAPDEVLLVDRPLQLCLVTAGLIYFVILYVLGA